MSDASPQDIPTLRHDVIMANGIEFGYLSDGPTDGPLALCLHGFPDSAWTWRYLLPELAKAGFRAVAPFMRGYAPTGLAPDDRYSAGNLVADVVALHDAFGADDQAVLIGHDWGALATYGAAAYAPERWRRIVTGAVPPALVFMQALFTLRQLKMSWYVFMFQTPLAEGVISNDNMALIDGLWSDWSPGYDAGLDVANVKLALSSPERQKAAISYYRAMFDPSLASPGLEALSASIMMATPQPTLYFHGVNDGCFASEAVTSAALDHLGEGSEIFMVENAGHFAHVEQPGLLNARIVEWLTA